MFISFHSLLIYGQWNNNWYIRKNTFLNFNTTPPAYVLTTKSMVDAGGWRACISNCAGKAILISSPITYNQYFDSLDQYMTFPAGRVLSSNIIIPKPGNDSVYYHFYINAWNKGGLYFAELNALANAGKGKTVCFNNRILDSCVRANFAVVKNKIDNSYRLLVTYDCFTLYCFKVNKFGVSTIPVISNGFFNFTENKIQGLYSSSLGNDFFGHAMTRIIASNDGSKLVTIDVPYFVSGKQENVFMYDFDINTGKASIRITIINNNEYGINYGCEMACFSGNDSQVYPSINPMYLMRFSGTKNYRILQYDVAKKAKRIIQNSNNGWDAISSMALGIDGKIYGFASTAYDTSSGGRITIIQYPNKPGKLCNLFRPANFQRAIKDLPNLTDHLINIRTNLDLTTCVDTVLFSVMGDSSFAKLTCRFGDGDSNVINKPASKLYTFKHFYKAEGRYACVWEGRTAQCNAPVWYTDTMQVFYPAKRKNTSFLPTTTKHCTNATLSFTDSIIHASGYQINWGDDSIEVFSNANIIGK